MQNHQFNRLLGFFLVISFSEENILGKTAICLDCGVEDKGLACYTCTVQKLCLEGFSLPNISEVLEGFP